MLVGLVLFSPPISFASIIYQALLSCRSIISAQLLQNVGLGKLIAQKTPLMKI